MTIHGVPAEKCCITYAIKRIHVELIGVDAGDFVNCISDADKEALMEAIGKDFAMCLFNLVEES